MVKIVLIFISLSLQAQDFQNVFFIKNSENEQANFKVFNSLNNSMAYGFWLNKSLNFNGTDSLKNPKMSEGLSYQGIRFLSFLDLYFTHSSLNLLNQDVNKIHNVFFSTIFEDQEVANYPSFSNQFTKTYAPIFQSLAPFTGKINLKSFNESDISYSEQGAAFSKDFEFKVRSKLKEKLEKIWERAKYFSDSGQIPPEIINDTLLPLNILAEIHLDKFGHNYYHIDFLLPGLIDFKKENRRGMPTNNPLEWQINPGITKNFTPPMQGLADALEKMSYLKDVQEGKQWDEIKNKLIRINIYKNLNEWDKMELNIEFGEIPKENYIEKREESNRLSLIPLETSNRTSALKIDGYLNLPKGKRLNKLFNTFKLEAWIHKLHFDLIREGKFKSWQERFDSDSTYKMVFRRDKSFLSLRIKKGTDRPKEISLLKKVGFTCVESNEVYKKFQVFPISNFQYTCFADFSNSEQFVSEFLPKFAPVLTRNAIGLFASLEMKGFVKNLEQINNLDLSEEKALFDKIYSLFKDNKTLLESLSFLPKEITNFNKK